jgi:predicted transcriptional regulator
MTKQELKDNIIKNIQKIDNERYLSDLNDMFERFTTTEFELEDWELERIKESQEQIKKGEYYTHDQVEEIIEKWLDE